jgi:hypothetical protein
MVRLYGLGGAKFAQWLQGGSLSGDIPFLRLLDAMRDHGEDWGLPTNGLAYLQVANDLANSAAPIAQPLAEELGIWMKRNPSLGASQTLRILGLATFRPASAGEAFVKVWYASLAYFTAEEQARMNWSPMVLEHALCKFGRSWTKDGLYYRQRVDVGKAEREKMAVWEAKYGAAAAGERHK